MRPNLETNQQYDDELKFGLELLHDLNNYLTEHTQDFNLSVFQNIFQIQKSVAIGRGVNFTLTRDILVSKFNEHNPSAPLVISDYSTSRLSMKRLRDFLFGKGLN